MVSFYGTGYAGLLLYITRKQMAVNGRIYGYTAYHKSKKVTSEGCVYFGTDLEWRGILLCSDTPEHPFLCPLPSTLPRVGGKVQFQLHETLFRSGIDLIIRLASYSALETAPLSLCSAMVTTAQFVSHTGSTMCGCREWQVNHTRCADKRCVHLTHQTRIHLELMYRWSR